MRGKRLMKQTDGADSQLYSGELKSKSFASICSDQTSNKENKEQQLHQSSTGTENNLSLQERTANSPSIQPPSMVRFELTTAQLMNDRKRRKRSSFSLRGKRKSSFGEMQTILHPDVPVESFIDHISPELPDPVRLRQLIVYCLQRYMESSNNNLLSDRVRSAFGSTLNDLLLKRINTSWYHRPMSALNKSLALEENPENQELAERISDYRETLCRLKAEEGMWGNVLQESATKSNGLENCESDRLFQALKVDGQQWDLLLNSPFSTGSPDDNNFAGQVSLEQLREHISCVDRRLHNLRAITEERKQWVEEKFRKLLDATWPDDISWDETCLQTFAQKDSAAAPASNTDTVVEWMKKGRRRKSEANLVAMDRVLQRGSLSTGSPAAL